MAGYIKIGDVQGESKEASDSFVFKPSDDGESEYRYELKNVFVTSYSTSGSADSDPAPEDAFDFVGGQEGEPYTEVEWTY